MAHSAPTWTDVEAALMERMKRARAERCFYYARCYAETLARMYDDEERSKKRYAYAHWRPLVDLSRGVGDVEVARCLLSPWALKEGRR